eukprot:1448719-Rhodomonas_salina.2
MVLPATPIPSLLFGAFYQKKVKPAICLRACYAMSGTDLAYGGTCYAMSGTDLAYGERCPVLSWRTVSDVQY